MAKNRHGQRPLGCMSAALEASGRTKEAYETDIRLTTAEPKDANGWARRARLAKANADAKDALAAITKASSIAPDHADYLRTKRDLLLAQHAFKAAADVGERLLEIDARDTEALRELAGGPEGTRKADAALGAPHRASRVDPMDRRTWNARGALLGRLGRTEEALTAYDQSLNLNPGDRGALGAKGRILLDLGRIPEARKAFEDGLILEPNHLDFLSGKAMCLAQESHFDDALSLLAVVFQKDPNHYDAHRTKGLCLLRTGHAADALPCFDFVLKASPKDARILTWKGEANEALGRNAEAFAAFDSAIESNPDFGEAWRDKSPLHVKTGQLPAAAAAHHHATVARPTGQ